MISEILRLKVFCDWLNAGVESAMLKVIVGLIVPGVI